MPEREVLGLVGTGRMGTAMGHRLLAAGEHLMVWNRTPAKAAPLVEAGAEQAGNLIDLGGCAVVFVMVSSSDDLVDVLPTIVARPTGLRVVVDCSTVSVAASATARRLAADAGVGFLACPVSGNPDVVASGRSVFVASGAAADFALARPYLLAIARSAVLVGDAEQSRLVKLCHNLYLGMLAQALVEVTSLAEKAGSGREEFLRFLGDSVVGSEWIRGRAAALVARDWTPTITTSLLRKDFDLGLAAARELDVPMPVAAGVRELIQATIAHGFADRDLLAVYETQAGNAGLR